MDSKKLVLVDGHSILNRAFYGMPDLTNAAGLHTGAVYGFLNILFKILDEEKADYLTVAFDVHAPTFRHEIYKEYKGTRKSMPEELREQVPLVKKVLRSMGVQIREQAGLEADDILGTLARRGEAEGMEVSLVSGDRDLLQIATEHTCIRIPKTRQGQTVVENYYASDVLDRYQVTPDGFIHVKALMGDSSDNVPGVPKVGEKTATQLIVDYGSVDGVYGEVVFIDPEGYEVKIPARREMRICSFLWIYYGFPASSYEGLNVEDMRYGCGRKLAERDLRRGNIHPDCVAGVPDSGVAHAIGYANRSNVPYSRPFVKYTPTWPRSFMPTQQSRRDLIAKMKLIPIHELIAGKKLLLIDDSIVRGTQLRETTEYLYSSGASEVHIRPACPPLVFGCKYLNFSRSDSEKELITRRKIEMLEGTSKFTDEMVEKYTDPDSDQYHAMLEEIRKELNFTSLHYHRLDDMIEAIDLEPCKLCTYCWNGKE